MKNNTINENAYAVEFLNCTVDKAQDFKIIDCDSHFAEFAGIHPSKIKEGKFFLTDILKPVDRDYVFKKICKKDAKYVYIDFDILNAEKEPVFIHCSAKNYEGSSLCRLVFADVSKSREKSRELEQTANAANSLIDLVAGGVCLFRVTPDMHFNVIHINETCSRLFGTTIESCIKRGDYRLDELIHPDDKTIVYQAIGRAMATGEGLDLEYRVMKHRDKFIWCNCSAAVQRYEEDGSPVFQAVFIDITRNKEAEKRADAANEKLINLLENLAGAIFFASLEKPFVPDYISGDFVRLIGYSRDEFESRFGNDLGRLIDDPQKLEKEIKKQVSKGGKSEITYRIKAKGARTALVQDTRKLVTQQDGSNTLICELQEISNQ
ncbi:MAG: PAS domain-containing protein [Clostridiales bacterium]|nr:PAS domain-containing protein [Clostridiales bacterium]